MSRGFAFGLVALCVVLTVYAQFIVKWRVEAAGPLPSAFADRAYHVLRLLLDPWVISAISCGLAIAIAWMMAISRLPLSIAYLTTSLTFPLVALGGAWLFREQIDWRVIAGSVLIAAGVLVIHSR